MSLFPEVTIRLPDWIDAFVGSRAFGLNDDEAKMRFVVDLARANVHRGGGPFAAAIFDAGSHELIAPGVNMVVAGNNSAAHAEMVAIMIAEKRLGSYTLAKEGLPRCMLVTSCEPCAQCFGALPWSGIAELLCGAAASDAASIGFDEGAVPGNWEDELEKRGIAVKRGILNAEAAAVLRDYGMQSRPIYNGREPG